MEQRRRLLRLKQFIRRRSRLHVEVFIIFCVAFLATVIAAEGDLFEALYEFSRSHESWELDELFSLLMVASLALIAILWRNLKYLKIENRLRLKAEGEIKKLAFYDSLTNLPNRDLLLDRLENTLFNAQRHNSIAAVLFIDVDNFKPVNDTYGHHAGDELLIAIAKRLETTLRGGDTLARIAGDEFIVVARTPKNEDWVWALAERITMAMQSPFFIANKDLHISVSVGVAIYPVDGVDSEQLIKNADTAMYFAKNEGKNKFKFFSPEIDSSAKNKSFVRAYLRSAMDNGELSLVYQPIVDMQTQEVKGAEALLRWNSLEVGDVAPSDFIPIAEETGLIEPIGMWVFRQACMQIKLWRDAGFSPIPLSINMSAEQLKKENFTTMVAFILKEFDIAPHLIELELTETSIMSDVESSIKSMLELNRLGISLAIDDFGTGYSSISYLRKLKLNRLKIDKSFVENIPDNSEDIHITNSIISLANSLHLELTVEGIETDQQFAHFRDTSCGSAQGYLFSRPVKAVEFEEFLTK